jgi:hypothetical protein
MRQQYSLKLFTQPGMANSSYTLLFSYPSAFRVAETNKSLTKKETGYSYNSAFVEDEDVRIVLEKSN